MKLNEGARMLGWGLAQGVTGVVRDPLLGAEKDGFKGCMKGVMTGVVGVITKPASSAFGFASNMATGIGDNIMEMGDRIEREHKLRVRAPKDFGMVNENYDRKEILYVWQRVLNKLENGKYKEETIEDFIQQEKKVKKIKIS